MQRLRGVMQPTLEMHVLALRLLSQELCQIVKPDSESNQGAARLRSSRTSMQTHPPRMIHGSTQHTADPIPGQIAHSLLAAAALHAVTSTCDGLGIHTCTTDSPLTCESDSTKSVWIFAVQQGAWITEQLSLKATPALACEE